MSSSNSRGRGFLGRRSRRRQAEKKEQATDTLKGTDPVNKVAETIRHESQSRKLLARLLWSNSGTTKANRSSRKQPPSVWSVRKSTSTHLTTSTTKSYLFMSVNKAPEYNECLTMEEFLLAEDLAALEESQQQQLEEPVEDDTVTGNPEFLQTAETLPLGDDSAVTQIELSQFKHQQPLMQPILLSQSQSYQLTPNPKEELGCVHLEFDTLAQAQHESTSRRRPILCIETQGSTIYSMGNVILSHPLVVEAMESLFVTCDYSTDEDDDDEASSNSMSRFFARPSRQARIRFLDDQAADICPPVTSTTTLVHVVSSMVLALEHSKLFVPQYLRLLLEEESGKVQVLSPTRVREISRKAVFGFHDPVQAEVILAGLDGVLSVRSGCLVRQSVIEVTYDSRRLSFCALVRHALQNANASLVYHQTNEERIAAQLEVQRLQAALETMGKIHQRYAESKKRTDEDDPDNLITSSSPPRSVAIKIALLIGNMRTSRQHVSKPALRQSILKFVPMTDLQSARANRFVSLQQFDKAIHMLSPRQGLIAMQALQVHRSNNFVDVVNVPITCAWNDLSPESQPSAPSLLRLLARGSGIGYEEADDISDCPTEDPTEDYEEDFLLVE